MPGRASSKTFKVYLRNGEVIMVSASDPNEARELGLDESNRDHQGSPVVDVKSA